MVKQLFSRVCFKIILFLKQEIRAQGADSCLKNSKESLKRSLVVVKNIANLKFIQNIPLKPVSF